MKYILFFLVITIFSCGDRTADSSAQTTETQSTSATAAPTSNNVEPTSQVSSSPTPAEQTASQTPATAQQNPTTQTSPSFKTPLLGTHWRLLELNGKNMEGKTAKEMYLLMDPGSPQFKAHSGCNLVMGEAKRLGGTQLLFTNLLNTTSECKTPEIDAEFQKAIEDVTGYDLIGNTLELTKKGKVTVLKYIAK